MVRHLALAFLFAALSACASDKPLDFACPRIDDFRTALPVTPLGSARIDENDPLTRRLGDAFAGGAATERRRTSDQPPSLLILSGGGQWGAYGAGLLKGWSAQAAPDSRPTFDVVTGVSTGATQATFAFIVTLIQGAAPPDSIMPGVERFVGIVGGLAILMVVSLVLWPTDEELAEQRASARE